MKAIIKKLILTGSLAVALGCFGGANVAVAQKDELSCYAESYLANCKNELLQKRSEKSWSDLLNEIRDQKLQNKMKEALASDSGLSCQDLILMGDALGEFFCEMEDFYSDRCCSLYSATVTSIFFLASGEKRTLTKEAEETLDRFKKNKMAKRKCVINSVESYLDESWFRIYKLTLISELNKGTNRFLKNANLYVKRYIDYCAKIEKSDMFAVAEALREMTKEYKGSRRGFLNLLIKDFETRAFQS